MSRSTRTPAHYFASGAQPKRGKQVTSRRLWRTARQAVTRGEDFVDLMDRVRGRAGSRNRDWGWVFFGDGRVVLHGAPGAESPSAARFGRK